MYWFCGDGFGNGNRNNNGERLLDMAVYWEL